MVVGLVTTLATANVLMHNAQPRRQSAGRRTGRADA
jgi:hypothetical protein